VNWLLLAIPAYLGAQLAIGVWVSPRIHTEDDYLVAGRKLGYPLTTFSIFATWFGAETCIASAGRAHEQGVCRCVSAVPSTQNPLPAMGCGFDSLLGHRSSDNALRRLARSASAPIRAEL